MTENRPTPEILNPNSIAIVTTTFYPKWHTGEQTDPNNVDKLRGDLAIQMLTKAKENNFQIVVIDCGNNQEFKNFLEEMGISVQDETEKGMSPSRQQGFETASKLDDVDIICWTEPEKISTPNWLLQAATTIANNEADIVIPKRDERGFAGYPDYQVEFETRSNKRWNNLLKTAELLEPDAEELDAWIGPRIFKNTQELIEIFRRHYQFNPKNLPTYSRDDNQDNNMYEKICPDLWPNAIFLPIANALKEGFKVKSVPVPYIHPKEQAQQEKDNPEFQRKRQRQYQTIVLSTIYLLRNLFDNENRIGKLELASSTQS